MKGLALCGDIEIAHIHLDAVGGAAGDMFVASMLDALPALQDRVFADLAATLPPAVGMPALQAGLSGGLRVQRFGLAPRATPSRYRPVATVTPPPVQATTYPAIAALIQSAALQAETATHAIGILTLLAEAESRVHGVALEQVHFHEIADWDSLLDVVAAGSVIAALSGVSWSVSDLPIGHGLVRTQHGMLPVPAPATAELLKSFRCKDDGIGGERVTPTGAAILAYLCQPKQTVPRGAPLLAVGMGAGTRELSRQPNILRSLVFAHPAPDMQQDEVIVIAFDVDDMTGEEIGIAADLLRATTGVLDVSLGQRTGKKGRPVVDFRVLAQSAALEDVARRCFVETSTIGLRWRTETRFCLPREAGKRDVAGEALRTKKTLRPDGSVSIKTESDDLATTEGLVQRRRIKTQAEKED